MINKKRRIMHDYDMSASNYEKRYSSIQNRKFCILEDADLKEPILDLGGGTGLLGKYLDSEDIINVDISIDMLRQSKEINVCADFDYLPFKSMCFGTVLSFTSVQNLPNFSLVFKELKRVMKPRSYAVISVLNKTNISAVEKKIETAQFKIEKKQECGEDTQFIIRLI